MTRGSGRTLLILMLGAAALLTGCTRFTSPAVAENGPTFDPALAGRWNLNTEEGDYQIEIQFKGAEGMVIAQEDQGDGTFKTQKARLVTARLGQLNLMSLQSITDPDPNWSLFRYDFDAGWLIVTPGSDAYWRKAIEDGRLEGKVEKGKLSTTVTVSASEAQLRALILGYGPVIFTPDPTPEFVFERAP